MSERLTELEQQELVEYVRRTLKEYSVSPDPNRRPGGFIAACYALGHETKMYRDTRAQVPEFDDRCKVLEEDLRELVGETAVARTMAEGDPTQMVKLAERVLPEKFAPKEALPVGKVVALIQSLTPEQRSQRIIEAQAWETSIESTVAEIESTTKGVSDD